MKKNRDERLDKDDDFILSNKYRNSLQIFLKSNSDGTTDSNICRFLDLTSEELEETYQSALEKLRKQLT